MKHVLLKRFDGTGVPPVAFRDVLSLGDLLYEPENAAIDLAGLAENVRHTLRHEDIIRNPPPQAKVRLVKQPKDLVTLWITK